MNSQQRVLTACRFEAPDRIPRFDSFWEYPDAWLERFGAPDGLSDIVIWVPDEGTFPTRARILGETDGWQCRIDSWGRTVRTREGAYFSETLAVPLAEGVDPDSVVFDAPDLDLRFLRGEATLEDAARALARAKKSRCVFGKTGGPYLRSTFVRGEEQFLLDIAGDPGLAKAIADIVGDHLTAIGVEEINRWGLQDTGIWIYDDMAGNRGPMFSPKQFERILLPAYRRMVAAYKAAGARYVFLHSDGDVRPLLEMLLDAGIDGLNPLERRANMDIAVIRQRYPKLILAGGMCNTDTLVNGPVAKIVAEAREIIDLGRHGGAIIGTHSISPEVPLEHFVAYHETCREYGVYG